MNDNVTATQEIVEIRDADGTLVEHRINPRGSFPVYTMDVRWDAVQVAYFTSAATWNYLTTPFVFTNPGVRTEEIDPWTEDGHVDGEQLRRVQPETCPGCLFKPMCTAAAARDGLLVEVAPGR